MANKNYFEVYEIWEDLIGHYKTESGKKIRITPRHIFILALIYQDKECKQTNEQLAQFLHCSTRTVASEISDLEEMKLITSERIGRSRILRYCYKEIG